MRTAVDTVAPFIRIFPMTGNQDPSLHQYTGLTWPALKAGTLIRRYKRFLADIRLGNDDVITAHCPNSGSMTACSEPGRTVYFSCHDEPHRKLKYTWELIKMPTSMVGVNTLVPNRLVYHAASRGEIDELKGYAGVRREVKAGEHTRFDLMLTRTDGSRCYVEIKNCTLVNEGTARFPDAVTKRGLNHLIELQKQVAAGHRCMMFYLIQRMDARRFKPADHIDPAYGDELRRAVENGVEITVYDVDIDLNGIRLRKPVAYEL